MKRLFASGLTVRLAIVGSSAFGLSACGGVIPASEAPAASSSGDRIEVGTGRDYPRADRPGGTDASESSRQTNGVASAPSGYRVHPEDKACFAKLTATGARFSPVPDTYAAPGCNKLGTVRLSALAGDRSEFAISNLGAVKCATATALGAWARYGVDRAARQILDSPLSRIETMGSYACRNIAGSGRRSAHATGNAIDVSAFVLADGRRIVLKYHWNGGNSAEQRFLRVVHASACKRFGTVLGPDYNAAHRDHFHLEGTGAQFCR
ncbi:MAG: extensin family protein [Pseudomonadota bacterium]